MQHKIMLRNSPCVGMIDVEQLLHDPPFSTIFSTVNVLYNPRPNVFTCNTSL